MMCKEILDILIKDKYTIEELNSTCGVYILTINNKHYVGSCKILKTKTSRDGFHYRLYSHIYKLLKGNHHSLKLQNAVNKYGVLNINFDIIHECPSELTIGIEQFWLNMLGSFKYGYNSCPIARSNRGVILSKESRLKMSNAKKGCIPWNKGIAGTSPSEETKKKLSDALIGRVKGPMSQQQREDIRSTLLKRNADIRQKYLLTLS